MLTPSRTGAVPGARAGRRNRGAAYRGREIAGGVRPKAADKLRVACASHVTGREGPPPGGQAETRMRSLVFPLSPRLPERPGPQGQPRAPDPTNCRRASARTRGGWGGAAPASRGGRSRTSCRSSTCGSAGSSRLRPRTSTRSAPPWSGGGAFSPMEISSLSALSAALCRRGRVVVN